MASPGLASVSASEPAGAALPGCCPAAALAGRGVGVATRTGAPGANDVAGVARVALAEDDLARLELARHRQLGDPLQIVCIERGEHRHAREQLDHFR